MDSHPSVLIIYLNLHIPNVHIRSDATIMPQNETKHLQGSAVGGMACEVANAKYVLCTTANRADERILIKKNVRANSSPTRIVVHGTANKSFQCVFTQLSFHR